MGFQDIVVTPLYLLIIVGLVIYLFGKGIVSRDDQVFFSVGISLKIIGAIALGLVYQLYYSGGDTFNYWQYGSSYIYKAFLDNPWNGIGMIFGDIRDPKYFDYFSQIMLKRSNDTLFVVRVAAFFDLFTAHTYSSTAIFFALYSFAGSWFFTVTMKHTFPKVKSLHLFLAIFCFPSVIIWGGGIMKDSLTLGSLLLLSSTVIRWVYLGERKLKLIFFFGISLLVLVNIRIYMLVIFFPIIAFQLYLKANQVIKSYSFKVILQPLLALVILGSAYFFTDLLTSSSLKYSLDAIPQWSAITANDLGYWTGKGAGSGYTLGYRDGTWSDMLSKFLPAVNVTLFRPYLWEVSNSMMLLAALESFIVMALIVFSLTRNSIVKVIYDPILPSFFIFITLYAFAVGVSSYNFGSLVRYKIEIYPFLGVLLACVYSKKSRGRDKFLNYRY